MPFTKGQSGNPGGRPKIAAAFRDRAQKIVDSECLAILESMLRSKRAESADRRFAIQTLIEYAYGKPQQSVDLQTHGPLVKVIAGVDQGKACPR